MSALDREILKYTKRGFEVSQKRTLKYGKRIFLKREKGGFFWSEYECIYIYYVDGDASINHMREFLKDYNKFYNKMEFDEGDKGYFICSGSMDNKLFRDLKKSLIRDKEILSTIKVKCLRKKPITKKKVTLEEERIKERITEREIVRRRVKVEIDEKKILRAIKSISFTRAKREREYETQLYQYLQAKDYPVEHERSRRGARFDLVLGENEIAIEIKIIRNASVFDALFGQIHRYKDEFRKIFVVLIDEFRNPSVMKREIRRIEEIEPKKIKVIVK